MKKAETEDKLKRGSTTRNCLSRLEDTLWTSVRGQVSTSVADTTYWQINNALAPKLRWQLGRQVINGFTSFDGTREAF